MKIINVKTPFIQQMKRRILLYQAKYTPWNLELTTFLIPELIHGNKCNYIYS